MLCLRWFGLANAAFGKSFSRLAHHQVQFRPPLLLGRVPGGTLRKVVLGWVVLRNVVPVCSVAVGLSRVRSAQPFVQADGPDGPPLNSHVRCCKARVGVCRMKKSVVFWLCAILSGCGDENTSVNDDAGQDLHITPKPYSGMYESNTSADAYSQNKMVVLSDGEFLLISTDLWKISNPGDFEKYAAYFHGDMTETGTDLTSSFVRYFNPSAYEEGFGEASASFNESSPHFQVSFRMGVTPRGLPAYPPVPDSSLQMNYTITKQFWLIVEMDRDELGSEIQLLRNIVGRYEGDLRTNPEASVAASVEVGVGGEFSVDVISSGCHISGQISPEVAAYRIGINSISEMCTEFPHSGVLIKSNGATTIVLFDSDGRNPAVFWAPAL